MTSSPQPHHSHPTVDAVAKNVIARCAPEELPHYDNIRDDFRDRGDRAPSTDDNPLGFGAVAIGLITGVVLIVLSELAAGTLTNILRPWWNRAWLWALARVGLNHATAPAELTPIPAEQIAAVIKAITAHAVRSGISPEQAGEVAAAVVSELGKPRDGDDTSADH